MQGKLTLDSRHVIRIQTLTNVSCCCYEQHFTNEYRDHLTYEHSSTCSNLCPIALEKLNDCDMVEIKHSWKVLNLWEKHSVF